MRRREREMELFGLSFLDVIACGFGAVVLLVLISDFSITPLIPKEDPQPLPQDSAALVTEVIAAEQQVAELIEALEQAARELAAAQADKDQLAQALAALAEAEKKQQQENAQSQADLEGLELVQNSLNRATIRPSSTDERDDEVGGIPVDSDYVLFIIDTSGSMKANWTRVVNELENIIQIHPRIKGFQILNDNGAHLLSGYQGRWIPDTPGRRKAVIKLLRDWSSASNSSPVEGLETALKRYSGPNHSLSVYIFGDDYSGNTYDEVLDLVARLNKSRSSGQPLAKIHAVGFMSKFTRARFAILMREVTRQNGGTFIGLAR
ncbi:vWA domain-containing protein [Rhodovibrionaceae bacterium A322]